MQAAERPEQAGMLQGIVVGAPAQERDRHEERERRKDGFSHFSFPLFS
jgi:hypothetical protein